jgi:hypothetical protein
LILSKDSNEKKEGINNEWKYKKEEIIGGVTNGLSYLSYLEIQLKRRNEK